jgi:hypothetical protein
MAEEGILLADVPQFPLLQFMRRAGTDALVTVSLGVHGVHFPPDFGYMGWKWLKVAKQLTTGKCSKYAGLARTA